MLLVTMTVVIMLLVAMTCHNAARDNDMNHNTRDVAAIMQLVTMT